MTDTPGSPDLAGRGEETPESLAEVLASIRSLVSTEAAARVAGEASGDVILLTPAMRLNNSLSAGQLLADGLAGRARPIAPGAPILDEEALRSMINAIVREELQGELGDRIGRNLRRLIRREIAQLLDEARKAGEGPGDAPTA